MADIKKQKIAIIIPYFGKFPNYFPFWLKSAYYNPEFTFMIFTDNKNYKSKKNVLFINMNFSEFKKYFQQILNFKICLNEPYKICDFRPLFGEALQEYISDFDFWGFGDIDLILGNLSKFITPEILESHDKIYEFGHLTILKNNKLCNSLWKEKHHIKNAYRFDEALRIPTACHFDEMYGLTEIAREKKIRVYNSVDFADIDRKNFNFFMIGKQRKILPGLFEWKNGNLTFLCKDGNNVSKQSVAYVHFQKRPMKVAGKIKNADQFIMIPNKIIPNANALTYLKKQVIVKKYNYYKKDRLKEMIRNVRFHHAIRQRIYRRFIKKGYRKFILDRK